MQYQGSIIMQYQYFHCKPWAVRKIITDYAKESKPVFYLSVQDYYYFFFFFENAYQYSNLLFFLNKNQSWMCQKKTCHQSILKQYRAR